MTGRVVNTATAATVPVLVALTVIGRMYPSAVGSLSIAGAFIAMVYFLIVEYADAVSRTVRRCRVRRKAARWYRAMREDAEIMRRADAILDIEDMLIRRGRGAGYVDATISMLLAGTKITGAHLIRARKRRIR